MRMLTLAVVIALAALGGCGDSIEHKLQQAAIALSAGNADATVTLADQVIESEPTNSTALMLRARALLRLRQFDVAEKAFLKLLDRPELALDAHRELMLLALARMADLLNRSEFVDSPELQEKFTAAKTLGHDQADWLIEIGKEQAQGEYYRARLIIFDTHRINAELKSERARLKSAGENQTAEPTNATIEAKVRQIDAMRLEAEKRLHKALEVDAGHYQAAASLLGLLGERMAWPEIWALGRHMHGRTDVPATLATDLVELLRQMPDTVQNDESRLIASLKILDAVNEQGRQNVAWKTSRATINLRMRETQAAYELAMDAFRLSPQDNKVRFTLGWALHDLGKYDQAKAVMQELATQRRDDTDIQALYGMILAKLGDNALAIDALRRAVDLNKNNQLARATLIRLNSETKGSIALVTDDIDRLYEIDPTNAQAIRYKFVAEVNKGSKTVVKALMDATERIKPLKKEHLHILVDGFTFLRDNDKALQYAQRSVAEFPDDVDSHLGVARVQLAKGDVAAARKTVLDLSKKFPDRPEVNITLTEMFISQGAFDRAVEVAEGILKQRPNDVDARLLLAHALARLSLVEDALEQVNKVIERQKDEPRAWALAARIYQLTGQADRAQECLEKIDESQIDAKVNPGVLAQLRFQKGQIAEALEICRAAIASGNTDPQVRLTIAAIHDKSNNLAEEEAHLVAFIRENPADFLPYQMLARFYVKTNAERGISQFQALRTVNDGMARLAQATLLHSIGRTTEALELLDDGLKRLIDRQDPMALSFARQIAIWRPARTPRDAAAIIQTFQKLVEAKILVNDALLDQVDLTWSVTDEASKIAMLDAIASRLTSSDTRPLGRLLTRYVRLGKPELGLRHVDKWLQQEPSSIWLMVAKADLLLAMKKPAEAADLFKQAIAIDREQVDLHERMGEAHWLAGNYPAAEAAYEAMAQIDTGARIRSLWARGSLYLNLGLNQPALDVYRELGKAGRASDPRLCLAMGRGLAALKQTKEARGLLILVPKHAPEYVAAQMTLVQLDQAANEFDSAKRRLEELARNPNTAGAAVDQLVLMSLRNRSQEQLLAWSDKVLQLSNLPPQQRMKWLAIRVAVQSSAQDWVALDKTLATAAAANPKSAEITAARACVLAELKKVDDARKLVDSMDKSNGGLVVTLSVGLGSEPPQVQNTTPFAQYLQALSKEDSAAAAKAAEVFTPFNNTIYRSDLVDVIEVVKARKLNTAQAAQQTALAAAALEAGLPALSEKLCQPVLAASPWFTPAHALRLAALTRQGKPLEAAHQEITRHVPGSSLNAFVASVSESSSKDVAGAIDACKRILARDGDHQTIRHRLTILLGAAGRFDEAIAILEKLVNEPGPLQLPAINDLAYLLTVHKKDRLEEASKLASAAYEKHPRFVALIDTLAWIELQRGKQADAMKLLAPVLPSLSTSSEVHYHAGVIYQAMGQSRWARYHLSVAAELSPKEPFGQDAASRLKSLASGS